MKTVKIDIDNFDSSINGFFDGLVSGLVENYITVNGIKRNGSEYYPTIKEHIKEILQNCIEEDDD